jgi:hypothetical protein
MLKRKLGSISLIIVAIYSKKNHATFTEKSREIGAMLGSMINAPASFTLRSRDL